MLQIIILRDPKENPKKCSLTPLRGKAGIQFISFEPEKIYEFPEAILLDPAGPPLTKEDSGRTLLVLDSSWRRLPVLRRSLRGEIRPRSIPREFQTAYPRRSRTFEDPASGLASVEALYAVSALLGEPDSELLRGYRWCEEFLESNRERFAKL